MKFWYFAAGAIAAGTVIGFVWPATADTLPMDNPVNLNGIEAVCTGIGSAEDDPRWKAYPIRVEFSNRAAQYLAGAHVGLSAGDKSLADFDCSGSWVLFRLAKGTYTVTAKLLDRPEEAARSATFSPPSAGQKRVVIQFPVGQPAAPSQPPAQQPGQ